MRRGERQRSACRRFEGERPNVGRALLPSFGRRDVYFEGLGVEVVAVEVRRKVCSRLWEKSLASRLPSSSGRGARVCEFATEGQAMFLSCLDDEALLIMTYDGRDG